MPTELYVLRHGNTFDPGAVPLRIGGRTNLPLSASGREQIQALAAHFVQEAVRFDYVFVSPLLRTRETAAGLFAAMGGEIPAMLPLEFLREIDYGPDEGQPEPAVVQRVGVEALKAWDEQGILHPSWKLDMAGLKKSILQFGTKILTEFAGKRVLTVTSNGIARFFPVFLLDPARGAEEQRTSYKLKTADYGVLRASSPEEGFHLVRW